MAKVTRNRTAFTVRLNQEDKELARWLGQYAHDHTMTKIVKLALYQFAGLQPPGSLAALASDAPRPTEGSGLTPAVIRDILREELNTTRPAPARRDDPGGDAGSGGGPSGGLERVPSGSLDLIRPRRTGPPSKRITVQDAEPALSPEDSAKLLIASIKGYGRQHQPSPG